MGTWGTGLYSDDLAADLREDYRELIADGLAPAAAVDRLHSQYSDILTDPDEAPVFWLALADTGWRTGHLDSKVLENALHIIDNGDDLLRWETPADRRRREKVLASLKERLNSPPPPPKKLKKRVRLYTDWEVGAIIGLRLQSGRFALLRVIGHLEDKGGRYSICELLDWVGHDLPSARRIRRLRIRHGVTPWDDYTQLLLFPPSKNKDHDRVIRTNISCKPAQEPNQPIAFDWPQLDRDMLEIFGLE